MNSIPKTKILKSPARLMEEAFALYQAQKFSDALATCKKVIDSVQAGDTAESAALLWIKIKQDDVIAWNVLGSVLTANKKPGDAAQALSIAERLDPNHAETYFNRAVLQKQKGYLYEARQEYDKTLALDTKHTRARINRINVFLDMGLWDEAKKDIDTFMEKRTNDPVIIALMGRYYRARGDYNTAISYLTKAHQLTPNSIPILINLTGCLAKANVERSVAAPFWRKLIALIDKSPNPTLYKSDYKHTRNLLAIYNNETFLPDDRIVRTRHLDDVIQNEQDIDVTIVDDDRRLYRFRNHLCYTEEWVIYNHDHLFANLMVTGKTGHTIFDEIDSAYLNDTDTPHIHLEGKYILLGGAENYYHWWVDFLPRVGILREFPELNDHKIIILNSLNPEQLATLTKVGISEDRLVKVCRGHILHCDELIVPSLTGRTMTANGLPEWMRPMINDWAINWIRTEFADWLVPKADTPKRIFISRAKTRFRRCINEDEVYAIAQRYGFTTLENESMNYQEQLAIYAGAEMVMGPHGAGFTNMLFAPSTATAIEMFPKHRSPTFYKDLCGQLGQRYVKFDGPITRLQPEQWADFGDFYIDLADVERVLASL
jgi:tetratricopeptide (TPR) repeat protein